MLDVVSVPAVIAHFVRSQLIEWFEDTKNNAGGGESLRAHFDFVPLAEQPRQRSAKPFSRVRLPDGTPFRRYRLNQYCTVHFRLLLKGWFSVT